MIGSCCKLAACSQRSMSKRIGTFNNFSRFVFLAVVDLWTIHCKPVTFVPPNSCPIFGIRRLIGVSEHGRLCVQPQAVYP